MLSLTNSLALALATLALAPEATFGRSGSASKRSSKSPYLRKSGADGWSAKGDPYGYHSALGQSLKFLEVQRSGRLSKSPGGYRVNWRHDQLLDDGKDVGMDLVGGWYEAGNRLKISLASGYSMARIAFSCLYYQDTYEQVQFEGKSMLFWCKREIAWGADFALKTHVSANPKATWQDGDKFVVMVGDVQKKWGGPNPGDFDCYRRAESIPGNKHPEQPPAQDHGNCPMTTRHTTIATSSEPASDQAADAAAGLAMAACLLAEDKPVRAGKYMRAAQALYDFAMKHPGTSAKRVFSVGFTYDTTFEQTNRLWASAALAFATHCDKDGTNKSKFCNKSAAKKYINNAYGLWNDGSTQTQRTVPVSNWNNAVYDAAFVLGLVTSDQQFTQVVHDFVQNYVEASGNNQIEASPKGMRVQQGNTYASLRLCTTSSLLAMEYGTMPHADPAFAQRAACYARSQLGYIFGDTGRSFVVGIGKNFPQQVHHRDAACRLTEDHEGLCDRKSPSDTTMMFLQNRPNPYDVTGAIVGGPAANDTFTDIRNDYQYTEVAMDYNAALTGALASAISGPKDLFKRDCSKMVPHYPW